MRPQWVPGNERGIALITVILLMLVLSAISFGTALLMLNSGLIRRYAERATVVDDAALAGLEEARSRLNGDRTLYPDSGYATLESDLPVLDASGAAIPGVRRWTYAGPSGIISGQYGLVGSIIAVVEDHARVKTVQRLEVNQESFAKYAYFTDVEPSNIAFGNTDEILGPVHTNDVLRIYAPSGGNKAKFWSEVTTAKTVQVPSYGTFVKGYTENAAVIPMPTVQDLTKLQTQATAGHMYFAGSTAGGYGQTTLRIEFVAVDLNGDTDTNDPDEGFIRVYRGNDPAFVVASRPADMDDSRNCGDSQNHSGFLAAVGHPNQHSATASLNDHSARCYLGGDPALTNGWQAVTAEGSWLPWGGTVDPRLDRPDEAYLHPISHSLNPDFKGVIYVAGKVAISGTVRGQVTLVSPNAIIIADDVVQATPPGSGNCDDILGLLSADDVIVADNTLNAPIPTGGNAYKTRDGTPDPFGNSQGRYPHEFIQAVVLALDIFTVENYDTGPTKAEDCDKVQWGRGCLYLHGGVIQRVRGAVGTTAGTGNLKRYDYNECAFSNPPPYFPTTGHFTKNRIYPIDPTGFDVAGWFTANQN